MSLPELPTGTIVATVGHTRSIAGRRLLVLPYAAPTGPHRGRRFRVETDGCASVFRVVFSVGGNAALRPPDDLVSGDGEPVRLRLRASATRTRLRVPTDLAEALADAGHGLDGLEEPAVRHLISMVSEAHDPEIRIARIRAAVTAVEQARRNER
jgi:hypothetical protein